MSPLLEVVDSHLTIEDTGLRIGEELSARSSDMVADGHVKHLGVRHIHARVLEELTEGDLCDLLLPDALAELVLPLLGD